MKHALVECIAEVCHEVNRAYCEALGDHSQKSWIEAEQWQRDSCVAGVKMHLDNPEATPEDSHRSWLDLKTADGWTWGPTKDVVAKTHPCMVPYLELPPEQRVKDYLFRAVVHTVGKVL